MSRRQRRQILVEDEVDSKGIVEKPIKFKCEQFDPELMDVEVWKLKFTTSLQIAQVSDEQKKKLLFIDCLNAQVLGTLVNICKPKSIFDLSFDELFTNLFANFKIKKVALAERIKFFSLKQGCESIIGFANTLRRLVDDCRFPNEFYQQALITTFVMGIVDNNIRKELLKKDYENFSDVVELANTLTSIQSASTDNVTMLTQVCNAVRLGPCYVCGGNHFKKDCRIKTPICNQCNRKGHISKICKAKHNQGTVNYNKNIQSNTLGGVNDVLHINHDKNKLFPMIVLEVFVNGTQVAMQFDTGSCVSILSEKSWKEIGGLPLKTSNQSFMSFTGQSVQLLGEFCVPVQFGDVVKTLKVFVASGVTQNILGRDWIFELRLHEVTLYTLQKYCTKPNNFSLQIQKSDRELYELIEVYSDVFKPGEDKCSKTVARLYLKENTVPVFKKARPVPLALRNKVREELDRLKNIGVLEEVDHSEWAAPCVIVKKPNGAIRICADFSTGLNQALEVQKFPLPTQDELFVKLSGGQKFTTLDLADAYLSIPMDEESKKLLVINTIFGLMRYNRLCFGVAPATAIFQRQMYSMLHNLEGVSFLLDDVIITGKDDQEHFKRLEEVLKRMKENGFCLNKGKCKFMQEKVSYLGLTISKEGISTNSEKIKSVLQMPEPQDTKQLETFLGMANFYSKFIPNFSEMCTSLNELRKKGVPWKWTGQCSQAVKDVKDAIVTAPVLVPFDEKLPIVVAADASSVGVGCAIFHRYPNGEDKPIAFASKTLTSAEKNYSQIEREALSIIYALKKFRIYLLGTHFFIQTDHRPLLSIFGGTRGIPTTTSCRIQRWALFLTNFNFNIEYVSTKKFGKVDCLSRLALEDKDFDDADEGYNTVVNLIFSGNISSLPVTLKEISDETEKDPVLREIKNFVINGWPSNVESKMKSYESKKNEISMYDGCLLWGVRTIIPPQLRKSILLDLHETHFGITKMKALARERVWWPGMDVAIEELARTCSLCNLYSAREPQMKYLTNWPSCTKPWTRVHIDFAGPFLRHQFLLVVDAYSGWVEIITMNSMSSSAAIKQIKLLICRYGIPKTLVSDNGTSFTSEEFSNFCKQFGIEHVTTPTYHPASNGQVEKYVSTMKSALRKMCQEVSSKGLEADLNNFLFKYRVTPHVTTGISPAELFIGRRLRCQLDLCCPEKKGEEDDAASRGYKHFPEKSFKLNEPIYWTDVKNGKVTWKPGFIKRRIGRNVWQVQAGETTFKKHADQLKKRTPGPVKGLISP